MFLIKNVYIADSVGSLKKRTAPLPPAAPAPRSTPSPSADSARSLHGQSYISIIRHYEIFCIYIMFNVTTNNIFHLYIYA